MFVTIMNVCDLINNTVCSLVKDPLFLTFMHNVLTKTREGKISLTFFVKVENLQQNKISLLWEKIWFLIEAGNFPNDVWASTSYVNAKSVQ